MHYVTDSFVRKLIPVNGRPVLFEVSEDKGSLRVKLLSGSVDDVPVVSNYIYEWFDMDRNIKPFYTLLKKDPDFAILAKNYKGFHMVGIPYLFEALCWCVIGQQINLNFAYKIKRRLVETYGRSVEYDGRSYFMFPEPGHLRYLHIDQLKQLQLTTRKAEYIKEIAEQISSGEISKEKLLDRGNETEMLQALMRIRGIGEWTANYTLMKSLRAMHCIPYGDVGVNNALIQLKGIHKPVTRAQVDGIFGPFENWKSYLVFYLWRSQRNK